MRDVRDTCYVRARDRAEEPHDAFAQYPFSNLENAAATLRSVLPEALTQRIDWQSLRLESGSHIDDLLSGTHSDLLFSTTVADRDALLYVLFEHQSAPDTLMPLRLEARQKAVTPEQRARIERCTDIGQLDEWLRRAATFTDTRELFEQPE